MSTVEERVKKVIAEKLDIEVSEVNNDSSFMEDLGADSLDLVELVMDLETEFDCTIDDGDAEKLLSVQSAIDFINENV